MFDFNVILLTPAEADMFLATNIMQLNMPGFVETDRLDEWGHNEIEEVTASYDLEVPGLRELILAAKSNATTTQPTTAPNLTTATDQLCFGINNLKAETIMSISGRKWILSTG